MAFMSHAHLVLYMPLEESISRCPGGLLQVILPSTLHVFYNKSSLESDVCSHKLSDNYAFTYIHTPKRLAPNSTWSASICRPTSSTLLSRALLTQESNMAKCVAGSKVFPSAICFVYLDRASITIGNGPAFTKANAPSKLPLNAETRNPKPETQTLNPRSRNQCKFEEKNSTCPRRVHGNHH
jgi:hypothetical protein